MRYDACICPTATVEGLGFSILRNYLEDRERIGLQNEDRNVLLNEPDLIEMVTGTIQDITIVLDRGRLYYEESVSSSSSSDGDSRISLPTLEVSDAALQRFRNGLLIHLFDPSNQGVKKAIRVLYLEEEDTQLRFFKLHHGKNKTQTLQLSQVNDLCFLESGHFILELVSGRVLELGAVDATLTGQLGCLILSKIINLTG